MKNEHLRVFAIAPLIKMINYQLDIVCLMYKVIF